MNTKYKHKLKHSEINVLSNKNKSNKSDETKILEENYYVVNVDVIANFYDKHDLYDVELVATYNGMQSVLKSNKISSNKTIKICYENILPENTILFVQIKNDHIKDINYMFGINKNTQKYEQIKKLEKVTKLKSKKSSMLFYFDADQLFTEKSDNFKMLYMSALTNEIIVNKYIKKINTMLNEAYFRFTVNNEPVLSAFKKVLVKFFLSLHIGIDDYPMEVLEYFDIFIDLFGLDIKSSDHDVKIVRGNSLASTIKEYFKQRNIIIQQNNDDTTLMYYWNLSGIPIEISIIESISNIYSFAQYYCLLYKLISDKLWCNTKYSFDDVPSWFPKSPIPYQNIGISMPPFTVGPIDFFSKISTTQNESDKLNIVREAFRILSSNNQEQMINNTFGENKTLNHYRYNPDQYNNNFKTNLLSYEKNKSLWELDNFNPEDYFININGVIIDKSNPKLCPIMKTYLPFGNDYDRCPFEILSYVVTKKLLEKFSRLTFEVNENNIYVKKIE